jgi:hypothetical protein
VRWSGSEAKCGHLTIAPAAAPTAEGEKVKQLERIAGVPSLEIDTDR